MYVGGGSIGPHHVHVANTGQLETNGSSFLATVLAMTLAVFIFKANLFIETKRETNRCVNLLQCSYFMQQPYIVMWPI